MKFSVTIEATIRKVFLIEEPTGDKQKAIEIAHDLFTSDHDNTETYYNETCRDVVETNTDELAINSYENANQKNKNNTVPYLCDNVCWDGGATGDKFRVFVPETLHLGTHEHPLVEFIGRVLSLVGNNDPDDCTFDYTPENT